VCASRNALGVMGACCRMPGERTGEGREKDESEDAEGGEVGRGDMLCETRGKKGKGYRCRGHMCRLGCVNCTSNLILMRLGVEKLCLQHHRRLVIFII
jgi:hypothetical protein